jgi:uncharacterized protein (DUF2147 family)
MRSWLFPIVAVVALVAFSKVENMANAADDANVVIAKTAIAKQVEKIKASDVEGLKATFTDRLKDKITAEGVQKAAGQLKTMTIDDLVASAQLTTDGIKIKMKNGRSLTTLVRVGDEWKADTIWFK